MIVYQSTKQGFREDVFSNEIDKKILDAYVVHLGRQTSRNEILSWKIQCPIWTGYWKIRKYPPIRAYP